jgi:hypothetical protein
MRKNLKEHKINNKNNFILGFYMPNKKICTNLINFFEKSDKKEAGLFKFNTLDKSVKDSTDLTISPLSNQSIIKEYISNLSNILDKYKKIYTYANNPHDNWGLVENFNIQRYLPNQGYHAFHTERSGISNSLRHLAFMTYLNDVKEGGETEWFYQKIKIKPETGLTVIWPVDWTFTHRGLISTKESKYIITGWYSYYNNLHFTNPIENNI